MKNPSPKLTNLDKVLYPRDGYTKGDVIAYYRDIAPVLLPYLHDNPLTLQRYPDGIDAQSFFEKHIPRGMPSWIETASISSPEGRRAKTSYMLCNDENALLWVANMASLVLHIWTSHLPTIEEPDFVFFDLDPGERCTLKTLVNVALAMRDMLVEIGLSPLVKTSGGTGLHVVVPLARGYDYEAAKLFAEAAASQLDHRIPDAVTLERSLKKRDQSVVYMDYLQVGRGKTIVSPYSLRARDGAPVSTPLSWNEVAAFARKRTASPSEAFAAFNLRSTPKRVSAGGDPWSGRAWKKQKLESAIARARTAWSS